jgi:hypothetical protein
MKRVQKVGIIVGALVAGAAVGGALFYLYPGIMFKGTGLEQQVGTPSQPSPQSLASSSSGSVTNTAGSSSNSGSSISNSQ